MNAGLDTTVVVRLLVGEPKDQAAIGWPFLEECQSTGTRAHVCELVVAESVLSCKTTMAFRWPPLTTPPSVCPTLVS